MRWCGWDAPLTTLWGFSACGSTSAGLKFYKMLSQCAGSSLGSQVYGRLYKGNGTVGILYAWYAPKYFTMYPVWFGHRHSWIHVIVWLTSFDEDAKILSVMVNTGHGYSTYTNFDDDEMDGNHVQLKYTWLPQLPHHLKVTKNVGEFQDLIMWDDMTEAARNALEKTNFFWSKTPVSTKKFNRLIKKVLAS